MGHGKFCTQRLLSCSNPRILYVITDLQRGGVPLHLYRLATAMRDRGWTPEVVSLAPPASVGDRLRRDGFAVHSCDARGLWDVRALRRLTQILRDFDPHIAHSLLFHANVALRLAALEVGFDRDRVLCEIQTVEVERRWHLWVDRWMHRFCRLTIGNSPSVIDHLATHARIPRSRLALVQGGIDPAAFDSPKPLSRQELGLPSGSKIILWVGRLDPVKGLSLLLNAWDRLQEDDRLHLLLVGEGPQREALMAQAKRMALLGRVHFLGARTDVPRLLSSADIFVFPSQTEGLPNALLEAMASRLPIVATDVPGCRDLIEHQRTGLLVPYGDTSCLAGAIRRLVKNPELGSRLGRRARDDVVHRWSMKSTVDAYEHLYRQVLLDTRT